MAVQVHMYWWENYRLMVLSFLPLRFSIRQLRKSPGFALTAILTLALGIGAVVSVFSVVNTVLLKPFAFKDADRLVVVRETVDEMRSKEPDVPDNYRHFLRLKTASKTLEDATIFWNYGPSISVGNGHPRIVHGFGVSPDFLRVFGVKPLLGRDLEKRDAVKGAANVVILTYAGWQTFFKGDPAVIGKTLRLNGDLNTVIGVTPADFQPPHVQFSRSLAFSESAAAEPDLVFQPLTEDDRNLQDDDGNYNFKVIARLKPGVTAAQTQVELEGLQRSYSAAAHLSQHLGAVVAPLAADVTSGISGALWLLFAAVGAVLLIACVNLANLQLARAVAAERESAVRAALGASRLQLLAARLTESLLLATVGGLAGVALAFAGVCAIQALAPANIPRLNEAQVNLPVLLFAVCISVSTALLFGLLPALQSMRANPQTVLQAGSTRTATAHQGNRVRSLLVAGEVAFTFVLLMTAGLVLHSFSHLLTQNRGFDVNHVVAVQVDLFSPQYGDTKQGMKPAKEAFVDRSIEVLRQLPGVQSVSLNNNTPLSGQTWVDDLTRPDHPFPNGHGPLINVRWIDPDYLSTMGMSLVSGRNFTSADRSNPYIALISEQTAREGFPGENPIGHKVSNLVPDDQHSLTIVGVVANTLINGLKDTANMMYVPYYAFTPWTLTFLVRSSQPVSSLAPEIRQVLWKVDPTVPIPSVKGLDEQLSDSVATDRFQTTLLAGFGMAALLLALLGVYGVLAYSVTLRQQEFGIRIALGSDKGRLMGLVLRQAALPVAAGAGAGLVLAFAVARWVSSLLYETQAADPWVIAGTLLLLGGVAAVAAILPARRASRVDPVEVLRAQ